MNPDQFKFEPVFDFDNSETSVQLHQGSTEISFDDKVYSGKSEVRLDLIPKARIGIYVEFDNFKADDYLNIFSHPNIISSFSIDGRKIEGFLTKLHTDTDSQKVKLKWCPKSEPVNLVGIDSTEMTQVVFHLFTNIPTLYTTYFQAA